MPPAPRRPPSRRAWIAIAAVLLATTAMILSGRAAQLGVTRLPRAARRPRRAVAALSAQSAGDAAGGDTPPFGWGVATASYQIEGGATEGGRGPSIWDAFSHTPGKTAGGATGDVACDFYHKWADDIALMRSLNVTRFRFSLAWTRLFPAGRGAAPAADGVEFYSTLIDALLAAGIEPWVTLYHWDLPLALQEEYGGWADARIVPDFRAYAAAAFSLFGARVHRWTTLNEPWVFTMQGYQLGTHAPGLKGQGWAAAKNAMLAHAAAAAEFRSLVPGGRLSVNVNGDWAQPWSPAAADVAAAGRAMDLGLHLFADPLFLGQWPRTALAAGATPFTPSETAALLAGKPDHFALNFYTAAYVRASPGGVDGGTGAVAGIAREQAAGPDGKPIGDRAASTWLYKTPWAFRSMLSHVHKRYGAPEIVVTENGCSAPGERAGAPKAAAIADAWRVDYYASYLKEAAAAVRQDGVPLTTYFAWSLLDNFEWADGYDALFGITHVDFEDPARPRTPKASALYLASLFGGGQNA